MINENAPGQGLGGTVAWRDVIQGCRDEQREAIPLAKGGASQIPSENTHDQARMEAMALK